MAAVFILVLHEHFLCNNNEKLIKQKYIFMFQQFHT